MFLRLVMLLVALAGTTGLAGCQAIMSSPGNAENALADLLRPLEMAPDGVALEIFQLRVSAGDREITEALWQEVDEQRLDVELRHRLVTNGFRAGVLGGTLPDVLAERLNLKSTEIEPEVHRVITGQSARPRVVRRVLQLGRREPATIETTLLRDSLHVVLGDKEGVSGRSFRQAQPVYTLKAEVATGQRVAVQLTPEIQHGQLRNRYAGSDPGIFLMTPSREREVYEALTLEAELAAGEMLVVGCLPEESGSLGHAFHTLRDSGPTEYKLILVRPVQVPGSEILAGRFRGGCKIAKLWGQKSGTYQIRQKYKLAGDKKNASRTDAIIVGPCRRK